MSSQEDEPNDGENNSQNSKKRRVQRACDVCRRKKIRCDGGQMPGNKCSNCITYSYECTYVETAKKRGPPKGYVESLETRLEKMEKLLNKLCPDADFSQELGGNFDKESWVAERNLGDKAGKSTAYRPPPATPASTMATVTPMDPDDLEPSDDEALVQHSLVQSLRRMKLNPTHMRFFGKSSSIMFIQTAMDLKRQYSGVPETDKSDAEAIHPILLHGARRPPQYWSLNPWLSSQLSEEARPHTPDEFPPEDLMPSLIDLFFVNINTYTPLLHRPTFEASIKDRLHLRDEGFGSTVLLVCAAGSRFSDDPRVYLTDHPNNPLSCGWEWFKRVQMIRKSLLAPPGLHDLQIYCLTAMFLQGSSAPQACWTIIGVGIRMAQDVGAHRKKVYNATPTVEEELWKRAFWVLVSMDRSISSALGRPCAIQDEDFDLDLPTECDDEYWLHPDPNLAFKQPPGKPSVVTFFNCFLRLNQILAFALRTIYSINKSKALLGFVGQQWEQHIVAELDSALNKWIDSVPDHLRWDPNRENIIFLNQSSNLYASYYQLQISVHRPFIPSPKKPSPLAFPSLAICTNAARSCTHVLDVQYKRTGNPLPHNLMSLFTSGIVLLLNIWGGTRSGLSTDPAKEMADVHKCMKILKVLEPRWHLAGRFWDILRELSCVGDLPLPQNTPPSYKRDRDSDSPKSATSNLENPATPPASANLDAGPRNIAGSRRVSRDMSNIAQPLGPPPSSQPLQGTIGSFGGAESVGLDTFALPIHSVDLGRLPLHPGFVTSDSSEPGIDSWYNPAAPSAPVSSVPAGPQAGPSNVAQTHGLNSDFDPRLMSIFAAQNADVYESLFSSMATPMSNSHPQEYQPPVGSVWQTMHNGLGVMPSGQAPDASSTDNTLAMWSNAPSGFEWDDWGTYISNVSGMNGPLGSSRPAGG